MLFYEQPESKTALEGTTATFNCSINNTEFKIHWWVNGTDLSHTPQGFEVNVTNIRTFGQLEVNAFQTYNNTSVTCVAIDLIDLNEFLTCLSDTALLIVVGKYVYSHYMYMYANKEQSNV